MKALKLGNRKFGRLKVISRVGSTKQNRPLWSCRCDCGALVKVPSSRLSTGATKSCGCLRRDMAVKSIKNILGYTKLPPGKAVLNKRYNEYKNSAKAKNVQFDITKQQFKKYTKQTCFYCNKKPYYVYKDKRLNGGYKGNGLDRLNPKLGYTINNIVSCCKICNIMKNIHTPTEFLQHISLISQNASKIKEKLCLKL